MNKNILLTSSLLALGLLSCGGGSTPSSSITSSSPDRTSSSEIIPSSSSSLSSVDEADFYLASLKARTPFFDVRRAVSVTKDSYSFKNGYSSYTIDSTNKIEHRFGSETVIAGFEDNDETVTSSYEIYETEDSTYTKDYDGKYHLSDTTRSDFDGMTFAYDYSLLANVTVAYKGYTATLTGKVSKDNLGSFLGNELLAGVEDFAFSANLTKAEAKLSDFTFTYTQKGYSASVKYTVSALEQNIDPAYVAALV